MIKNDIETRKMEELGKLQGNEDWLRLETPQARKQHAIIMIISFSIVVISTVIVIYAFSFNNSSSAPRTEMPADAVIDHDALLGDWYRYTTGIFWYTFNANGTGIMLKSTITSELVKMT